MRPPRSRKEHNVDRSPEAFCGALEQRIRTAATKAGVSMNRFRQLLVFERFLVRVFDHFGDQAIVKGGLVLEAAR